MILEFLLFFFETIHKRGEIRSYVHFALVRGRAAETNKLKEEKEMISILSEIQGRN